MSGSDNTNAKSYVLVQIGDHRFAMSAATVSELAPPVRLHQFPQTSPLVPVYDVSRILAGKNSPAHRFYLVASREFGSFSEASAIPVDGECELVTAPIQPSDASSPKYISGRLAIGEENIEILDLNALVTSAAAEPNEIGYAEPRG
jgi:chemotaxis signal transduction protein